MLLPFLQRYLDRGEFPDGRGMLYQPAALINAFEVFVTQFKKYEYEDQKRRTEELSGK